jgi:hypothetical protein
MEQPVGTVAQPHPPRRLAQTHAPPRPQLPSARPPTELESQQERRTRGAGKPNLWTTRAGNAQLWTTSGTPRFRTTPIGGEVPLPAYLAPPGAQQGTAHLSSEFDPSGPAFGGPGERLDPPHNADGPGYDEQRDPQDSVSRASCPQIFTDDPGRRLDTRRSTHECQCRRRPAASPTARAGRAARPGNGRERLGPPRCRGSYTAGEPRPRPTPAPRTARRGIRSPMAPKSRDNRPGWAGGTTPP